MSEFYRSRFKDCCGSIGALTCFQLQFVHSRNVDGLNVTAAKSRPVIRKYSWSSLETGRGVQAGAALSLPLRFIDSEVAIEEGSTSTMLSLRESAVSSFVSAGVVSDGEGTSRVERRVRSPAIFDPSTTI